jgi:kynureninase
MSAGSADRSRADEHDYNDPLRGFRGEFHLPVGDDGQPFIYFAGHSLGLQPRAAARYIQEELSDWSRHGVLGHHAGRRPWVRYHEELTAHTAELAGAGAHEVVNMNSLTVNLHLLMVSFYRPTAQRFRILIERGAFPSDRYAVESQVRFHGLDPATALIELAPREGEDLLRFEDVESAIERAGATLALVLFPGVQYLTGQAFDLAPIVAAAHRVGAVAGFDLAHAIGNLELGLHASGADFAVWCSYKYLNSGPGALAGAFVHERHANAFDLPRFAGWWGHDKATRFLMGPEFRPIPGAEGWQVSNPPILSAAPLIASLDIFRRAGMSRLRTKSVELTGFLADLVERRLAGRVSIVTPRDPSARGNQLSLRIAGAAAVGRRVFEQLETAGAITDWREPDLIRVGPTPLYNTFDEALRFVELLERSLSGKAGAP